MSSYSNYTHYYPLHFAVDPHAPQYLAEQPERALALHHWQQLGDQPTPNAIHAQECDEFPNQHHIPEEDEVDFDPRFRSYGYRARQQAEIELANRAIRDQAVRERETRIQECNFTAFEAHLEEEHLFAHHRAQAETFLAQAETFLNPAPSNVPFQDEPLLKDVIMPEHALLEPCRAEHPLRPRLHASQRQ